MSGVIDYGPTVDAKSTTLRGLCPPPLQVEVGFFFGRKLLLVACHNGTGTYSTSFAGRLPAACSVRPDGDIDLAVMTSDGGYHNAFFNTGLGWWGWGDIGNPSAGAGLGSRPSIASTMNSTTSPGSSFFQMDIIVTDSSGRVFNKQWSEQSGGAWFPGQTGWYSAEAVERRRFL